MNVLNIHQKDEQYLHPCSSQVRVQKWRLLRVQRRLGLGFGDGQVRVKWRLLQGQKIVYNGVVLSCLSFFPFMAFQCTQNLHALLVVASHSFVIASIESIRPLYCSCQLIQLFHFMNLECYISCLFSSCFQQVMGPHQAREKTLCQNKKQ